MKAKARKEPTEDQRGMSKAELLWEEEGIKALEDFSGFSTTIEGFEPLTFKSGKIRYTPDFLHIGKSGGEVIFVEVKASKHQGSYRYSRTRAIAVAADHPHFYFLEAVRNGKGWILEWLS